MDRVVTALRFLPFATSVRYLLSDLRLFQYIGMSSNALEQTLEIFVSSTLTYISRSGRCCSWKNPSACITLTIKCNNKYPTHHRYKNSIESKCRRFCTYLVENYPWNAIMNFIGRIAIRADYSEGWTNIAPDSRATFVWIFRNQISEKWFISSILIRNLSTLYNFFQMSFQ